MGRGATVVAVVVMAAGSARAASAPTAQLTLAYLGDATPGIVLVRGDGSDRRDLRGTGGALDVAWSPDGARLAFGVGAALRTIRPDGTGGRRVAIGAAFAMWSRDSKHIYYHGYDADYVVNSDGSHRRRTTTADPEIGVWSPDGKHVAYADEDANGRYQLYVDGRPVTKNRATYLTGVGYSDPSWSPDGTSLAFNAESVKGDELDVIRADGSGRRRLSDSSTRGTASAPSWAPNGRVIAFTRSVAGGDYTDVFVIRPDGSGLRRLSFGADAFIVAWRPTVG